MKRLLTKTICLQAILFMGIAFSTSCNNKKEEIIINNTKEALAYLNTNKNYTLTYSGKSLIPHKYTFTENAIGRTSTDKPKSSYYYYSDKGGTFKIEYSETISDFVSTEYRSTENVWNTKLSFNFYNVGTSFINELTSEDNEVRIKNNDYKRTFVQLMGYSASDFTSIDSLTAKYEKESKNLTFKCKIGEKEFTYIASQFGNSKIEELSKLSPSVLRAYTPDTSLSNARDTMFENNYIQNIYLFGEEESGYTGYYIFNAHYFGQVYYSNPGYLSGYISLHTEEVKDGDDPHPALEGTYYYSILDANTSSPKPSINSNPINKNTNIPEVMNYPSNLILWSNMQRFIEWNSGDDKVLGDGYYTRDTEILIDFSNNFNMDGAFTGQTPYALGIDIDLIGDEEDQITFYYYFKYGGKVECYPIPFFGFGTANVPLLDAIYNKYHTIED